METKKDSLLTPVCRQLGEDQPLPGQAAGLAPVEDRGRNVGCEIVEPEQAGEVGRRALESPGERLR